MVYFFFRQANRLPAGGWGGPKNWILPVVAYLIPYTGGVALWTRQCMLEAMT